MQRKFSIRDVLVLTISGLTLLILFLAARGVYDNWRRLADIQSLHGASRLSDQLFDATEKLSVERDVALSMLYAPDPSDVTELKPRLAEDRRAADAALNTAMQSLNRYDFPELVRLRADTERDLKTIASLRLQIDRDVGLPLAQRPSELPRDWERQITGLMQETEDLWGGFIAHFTGTDAVATQHLLFKQKLRTIVDYTGRERSLIGQLIAENASPSGDQIAQLFRGQGVIAANWQMSRTLADQSGLYAAIAPRYKDADSHYSTMRDMAQSLFFQPGALSGAPSYPIGADLWFELSDEAFDTLQALRASAIAASDTYLDGLIGQTRQEIAGNLAIFCLALGLCAYSFWIIIRRVLKPIHTMIAALLKASADDDSHFIPQGTGQDEIEKLQHVLAAFRQRADEVKQGIADLNRSEARLRAVVDNALDGLITIDSTGAVVRFNPACEAIFQYRAEDVIGRNVAMLLPELGQSHDDDFARLLAAGDARIIGAHAREISAKRKNGEIFPMEVAISGLNLDEGVHYSGIVRDITARKEAEQELLRYNAALERSNRELDDFAYIASHDLKEPLRGIHNHSRFLLEDNEEKLDKESVGRLQRLIYLSQRMERLVNDLLYFSRLGRQELAVQPTDLAAAVRDVESTLDTFLEERNARIVIKEMPAAVTCDKPRVTELFRNLITNAVKYNDKKEKIIEVGYRDDGANAPLVFYVKDNGRGIASEFHEEIFRIFKRLQNTAESEDGTGAGLTFVKKIVERHGGRIWLESEPGTGTTFYFTLEATRHEDQHGSKQAA